MAVPHWVGLLNLGLATFALAVLLAAVAVMATVPVEHWQSGTVTWKVGYQQCTSNGLCPIQLGDVDLPAGTTTYLHWSKSGAPLGIQFWVVNATGSPIFYSNSTQASFEYTTVDTPYELILVIPEPLDSPTTLELNYSFETSSLLL